MLEDEGVDKQTGVYFGTKSTRKAFDVSNDYHCW